MKDIREIYNLLLLNHEDDAPEDEVELYWEAVDAIKALMNLKEARAQMKERAALEAEAKGRLEYLRGELRAERISTGELVELQNLKDYIEPEDVELLEAAGVPEFGEEE